MADSREHYASGNWFVMEGSEEEFMTRWKDWLAWTAQNVKGFGSATLIRYSEDSRQFLSFSDWDDLDSLEAWKTSPEFREKFSACRSLCEDFQGGNFVRVVTV